MEQKIINLCNNINYLTKNLYNKPKMYKNIILTENIDKSRHKYVKFTY